MAYAIRGQGTTFGNTPSVVTYFAEVPMQANSRGGGSNITFFDLESIQVLKGPQGTLFGRSTTGGAVLLTPRKPTDKFDAFVEGTVGSYGQQEMTAAVNIPLIEDRLAVRVAANYSYRNGFTRSLSTGQDLDDRNRFSYRISVLAKPTDWLTNTTIFSDASIDENGTSAILYRFRPENSLLDTSATGPGRFVVTQLCGAIGGGAQCIASRLATIDRVRNNLATEYARIQAGGSVRRAQTPTLLFNNSRSQQIINTTALDFGTLGFLGETSLKNIYSTTRYLKNDKLYAISGSQDAHLLVANDLDFSCTVVGGECVNQTYRPNGYGRTRFGDIWSDEVQLSGKLLGRHDWIVGFFKESSNKNDFLNFSAQATIVGGALSVPAGMPSVSSNINQDYLLSQTGYFGQATIDLGDVGLTGLKLTGGYRHSIVKNRLTDVPTAVTPGGIVLVPGGIPTRAALKQSNDSYTITLDYAASRNVFLYAATRRGFKQGGINVQAVAAGNAPGAIPYFQPEIVTDYEVGAKTEWDFGGVRGRTNIALFHSRFRNLQRGSTFFNGTTFINQIANIAASRVNGIELENSLRFGALDVDVAYAFLDNKYTEYPGTRVRPTDGVVVQNIDTPVIGSPRHKIDVTARYLLPLAPEDGELSASANFSYQSATVLDDDGLLDPEGGVTQKGYGLLNLRLDWKEVFGSRVDLSVFARNVTNKLYLVGAGNIIAASMATTTAIYGDPRTFGAQVRVRFGASAAGNN